MRIIATALLWALVSPVALTAQVASGADMKVITPSDKPTAYDEPPATQRTIDDIRPTGEPIRLSPNLGTMIHLPGAARTVFIANEDIADVLAKDLPPSYIYLTAKKAGATVVYAADSDGHVLLNKVVDVKPGPVAIIRAGKIDTGEPPPAPNFLLLPLQGAQPLAATSK